MKADDPKTIVSTTWLSDHLSDPDLRILDASWYLPFMKRDPIAEYKAEHIPEARFFDIDEISDSSSDLPHMVPPVEKFTSRMRKMGVGNGNVIVVYDGEGLFSAARVWWLFKLMGHNDIAVLDGGLPKWKAENRPVQDKLPSIRNRHMMAKRQNHMIKDVTQVASASKLRNYEIIDARPSQRFRGEAPEPRKGLRSGHIPGSKNVFFKTLLEEDGTMKKPHDIRAIFLAAGVNLEKPTITTCGSGVTAAVLNLGLSLIGKTDHALYDGSWSEWGQCTTLPIATGES